MDRLMALVAVHGYRAVQFEAWGWAASLDAETRRTVQVALAADGVDGIGDLVLAGPALGGLGDEEFAGMLADAGGGAGRAARRRVRERMRQDLAASSARATA